MEPRSVIAGVIIGLVVMSIPIYTYNERLHKTSIELERLHEEINNLQEAKSRLSENITRLKTENKALQDDYNNLQHRYDELRKAHEKLRANYTILKTNYTNLLQEYVKLNESYNLLEERYNDLEYNYTRAKEKYETYLNTLYQASYWVGFAQDNESLAQFYVRLLEKADNSIQGTIPLSQYTGEEPAWKTFNVFTDVEYYLSYCHDSHVRYPDPRDPSRITIVDEVFKLPNETWSEGCGDCDDLALFTYAILDNTKEANDNVYIIGIYNETIGHWAVIYVEHNGTKRQFYVIDPAGDYWNGLTLYYKITVRKNYRYYDLYLSPLGMGYQLKHHLRDYVELVYYDNIDGETYSYENAPLYYYTSAQDAISDWINYWQPYMKNIVKIEIIGKGIYVRDANPANIEEWLDSNG